MVGVAVVATSMDDKIMALLFRKRMLDGMVCIAPKIVKMRFIFFNSCHLNC